MNRQPFPVQRISPHRASDNSQKSFVMSPKLQIQPQPNPLVSRELRASVNKFPQDIVYDVQSKTPQGDVVPRSAPLRLNKLVTKDDGKEFKEHDKKSPAAAMRSKFPEIQTPDRFKGSNQLRMPKIIMEEVNKGSSSVRKQKETPKRPGLSIKVGYKGKTPEMLYGFETERPGSKYGSEVEIDQGMPAIVTEATPRREENSIIGFISKDQGEVESNEQDIKNEYMSNHEVIQRQAIDEILETSGACEEFGEKQTNHNNKQGYCPRGAFMREHISAAEFQKQNDQKKIMKEYLDLQLNEKKRLKEEEKQRQRDLERKEEERVKNEILQLEKRHEKELAMDNSRKGNRIDTKMDRSDSRTTATPLSKGPESLNFDSRVEEKAKSKEHVEIVKNKTEGSQPNSRETIEKPQSAGVDELVEENKQLRDENIKKKEIIDILINALRQQDQTRPSLYNELPRKNSSSSRLQTPTMPPKNLIGSRVGESPYNLASYPKDGSYDDKFFVPNLNVQKPSVSEEIYIKSPKPQMIGNIDLSTDLSQRHYILNTPVKPQHPYRIFMPCRKDIEAAQNRFQGPTSPRSIITQNNVFTPSGSIVSYINEAGKQNIEPKQGFLPVLPDSLNSKTYQKSNLLSNLEIGVSSTRYYDSSKYNSPMKTPKETHSGMKHSHSDVNLVKGENNARLIKDSPNMHKNLLDLLNPVSVSRIGPSKQLPMGFEPKKAEYSITVVDEAGYSGSRGGDSYPLRNLKTHENLKGMGGISIVDMANRMASNRRVGDKPLELHTEEAKPYFRDGSARTSERVSSEQTPGVRGKFPIEVFNVNMKRSIKEKVKL